MGLEIFLIDFENVQPSGVGRLVPGTCRIMLFLGQNQNKVPVELTRALQPFGADVEYLNISGNGPNAVDFHIAFYIGHLAQKHPGAKFAIVSGDTGFDPLVRHLSGTLQIGCRRIKALPAHAANKVVAAAPPVAATAAGQGTAPASIQASAATSTVRAAGANVVALKPAAVAAVAQPVVPVASAVPVAPAAPAPASAPADGKEDEDPLLAALGYEPVGLDALIARTGLPAPKLQARLLELELEGRVGRLPGGLFQRVASA